ncbi:hypothetical protein Snas_3924 [Stackebrandtia nassauensis DSM 44728]|uniref:Protein-glutamine gamma-glutamyltransferase-like C-terminal domain-containing protein n=1 Tax=Stackebrandtia nassauensis (strain DSM 44728 / CIP 108903 / NRRL B-16338 / NBRC 102104 / LLR-40K-21) TaxID=446470 RepID=D3PZP2_STANL|nr:hypothetical protein Snas_3924 [Stackebrandtia nassauensis DSM 44728]
MLVVALGFAVLAWLVASATLSGHRLASPGVPEGVPSEVAEHLPKDLYSEFPAGVDLRSADAADLPPGLLDKLGEELSSEELAKLSQVLSDDLLLELAKRHLGEFSPGELQKLWDSLDSDRREQLLDELAGELTQDDVDKYRDELTPELYDELSDHVGGAEPEPSDTPGGESGEPEPSSSGAESSGESSPTASAQPSTALESSAKDQAADKDPEGPPGWLRELGEFTLLALKWLVILGLVALAGYLLYRIGAALFGWWPRRREKPALVVPEPEEPRPEVEVLREAVAEGLSDVEAAADPRRGVIDCWQRLERAAAAAGLARLASETPGELVARVMAAANVDAEALTELADTYRRARYGPHAIGEDLRQRAVAALAAVDAQLAAAQPAEPVEAV